MLYTIDTENPFTAPTLEGGDDGQTWNGWEVPTATADAFRTFIEEWQAIDPNGTWDADGVREAWGDVNGAIVPVLVYVDGEGNEDVWQSVGQALDGTHVYALDGWAWVKVNALTMALVAALEGAGIAYALEPESAVMIDLEADADGAFAIIAPTDAYYYATAYVSGEEYQRGYIGDTLTTDSASAIVARVMEWRDAR